MSGLYCYIQLVTTFYYYSPAYILQYIYEAIWKLKLIYITDIVYVYVYYSAFVSIAKGYYTAGKIYVFSRTLGLRKSFYQK